MNDSVAVKFQNVTKEYKLNKKSKINLISLLFAPQKIKSKKVLDHISFTIQKGEAVAILGKNGMGKSTILKMLSGISYPTSGEIITNGKTISILELNAGFEQSFTGRENIYLKCRLLGYEKEEIDHMISDIIQFADIGEYIDEPVRIYSSGMRARLGFAISSHVKPEILALDEIFSVGDYKFKKKCFEKITQIKENENVTFILVTHSPEIAKQFCTRGILLHEQKILFDGDIDTCIQKYTQL